MSTSKPIFRIIIATCALISALMLTPVFRNKQESNILAEVQGRYLTLEDYKQEQYIYNVLFGERLTVNNFIINEIIHTAAKADLNSSYEANQSETKSWCQNQHLDVKLGISDIERHISFGILKPYIDKYIRIEKYKNTNNLNNKFAIRSDINQAIDCVIKIEPFNLQDTIKEKDLQEFYEFNKNKYLSTFAQLQYIKIPFNFDITQNDVEEEFAKNTSFVPEKRTAFVLNLTTDYSRSLFLKAVDNQAKELPSELLSNVIYFFDDVTLEQGSNQYTRALFKINPNGRRYCKLDKDKFIWLKEVKELQTRTIEECRDTLIANIRNRQLNKFYEYIQSSKIDNLWRNNKVQIRYIDCDYAERVDWILLQQIKRNKGCHFIYGSDSVTIYRLAKDQIYMDRFKDFSQARQTVLEDYQQRQVDLVNQQLRNKPHRYSKSAKNILISNLYDESDFSNYKHLIMQMPVGQTKVLSIKDKLFICTVISQPTKRNLSLDEFDCCACDLKAYQECVDQFKVRLYPRYFNLRQTA